MKKIFLIFCFIASVSTLFSQNEFEVDREFGLFTSHNLSGYLKPLTTSISQSLNSGFYTTMNYSGGWSFGLNVSASQMFIPRNQTTYSAETPDLFGNTAVVETAYYKNGVMYQNQKGYISQPTIYGGISTPVFASPQNQFAPDSFYKSVSYMEGNNISTIAGVPAFQLFFGIPTHTQFRFKYFGFSINNAPLTWFALAVNQNLSHYIPVFGKESPFSFGIGGSYQSISRSQGIDISGWTAALNFGGNFKNGLGFYTALQLEDMSGTITAQRKATDANEIINNPYSEVRNGLPLIVNFETFTNFKALAGVNYRYGIMELNADFAWATQPMVSAGLSLYFIDTKEDIEVFDPIQIPYLIDTVPVIARKFPIKLRTFKANHLYRQIIPIEVNIAVLGPGGDSLSKITVEIYRSRQLRALLPFIFFDENSSDMQAKYIQINPNQASNFNYNELLGKNSLETYYHILNVIGKRLKEHPEATITLTGCNNNQGKEKNNKNLSTQRAETVKNYLLNVWQISPDKIKTIGRNLPDKFSNPKDPDGIAENQRVELSSDTWEILEPIMIEDVVKKINPADITVKQTIKSPKPINNYKFNASTSQGDLSGIDVAVPESDEVKIHIDLNKMHNVNDTLKAYVELENEDEYVITPVNKIPIEVIEKDISLNLYNLILFDFNSAELGKANSKITEFINNDLEPDAQVKVIGYTDRIGETDHNAKLSTNRANSTSKSLKSKNIEAIGVGENELLYDNDSPEGRFYCRTVQVQVQQKNK